MVSDVRGARGFSLLEAIVALTILASVGLAMFAAMSQSMQMVGRAETSRAVGVALRNALATLEQINPSATPTGEAELGAYTLRWDARLLEPPHPGATGFLSPGLYDIALYNVAIELRQNGQSVYQGQVRRVGYVQARKPPPVL